MTRIERAAATWYYTCQNRSREPGYLREAADDYIGALRDEVERLTFENRDLQAVKDRSYDAHVTSGQEPESKGEKA